MDPIAPLSRHISTIRSELAKIMQRLFWCCLLLLAFGFVSSLPAQATDEKPALLNIASENTP